MFSRWERFCRATWWPFAIPAIMWNRRIGWRAASHVFHLWVWGYA